MSFSDLVNLHKKSGSEISEIEKKDSYGQVPS